ncbi:rho guanine nucleotide exchange factor 10-like protein isoform X3 [Daphnia pulicaria]|uniref:rho guanine nucleotide exchange factor 10-like protein isoform X3 n=1 Tax=Daphnia pulicaria TaxID=35523 RepID=UPI001EE9E0E8|nr:rho guanine nucleotide exchange factor 10-like protein isoform X3 [Daphnia pulicaria]
MESSSVYSDLMAATGRQSMRMRRRSAGAGSFGGSGRWTLDSNKKVGRKKVDKCEEETREHVVLLLYRRSTCEAEPTAGDVAASAAAADCLASSPTLGLPSTNGSDVVDSENRIYEDIDQHSTGSNSMAGLETSPDSLAVSPANAAATDSGFSSGQTNGRHNHHQVPCSSDDSWGSGEFETFSSDEAVDDDDDEDAEKINSPTRSGTLRALLTGKSIRDKLRGTRSRSREEDKSSCAAAMETPTAGRGVTSPPSGERRFSRLFSLRRSSASLPSPSAHNSSSSSDNSFISAGSTPSSSGNPVAESMAKTSSPFGRPLPLPQLLEEDEIMAGLGLGNGSSTLGSLFMRRHQPPTLPPIPPQLSAEQLKRRYIVATIIHSENSYVSSLQRLVNEYKKPLEESNPPILGSNKISTLFHRLPEILHCHTLFRLALSECARTWDTEEKIGDVFVANFSKAVVLDIYSDFINNFSQSLEVAKQESKRKSALADFLKVKQISSHDRLSFFGLMVKPVQRFPQFILLLQDLLKHTPQGHQDRMSLQLALTQLESLAELLNERKRETEQYQAFRDTLRHVSGKFSLRPLADNNRYLLRQDNMNLVEFNQSGMISKTKERRLLLLNDLLVCVTVASKSGDDYRNSSERLTLKWAFPITDVEVEDTSTSPTLSRLLSSGSNMRSSEAISGVDNLCQEMNQLMHDYEVITRIDSLIVTLHGQYETLDRIATRAALNRIQQQLQQKDEEMAWIDSCCLQLLVRNRSGKEEKFTFQTESPDIRKDWVIELRLAQLALDPKNSPSWDVLEQERRPSTKMPLFVKSLPVYRSHHETEVRCGCFYTILVRKSGPSVRCLGPRLQNYLWVVTSDGISSHVTLLTSQQPVGPSLKEAGAFSLVEVKVTSVEFSPGTQILYDNESTDQIRGDLVWLGTESRRILLYSAHEPSKTGQVGSLNLPAPVVQLRYHWDQMFVALANGIVAIFKRNSIEGGWELNAPATLVSMGDEPVVSLLPIGSALYAACGRSVFVLDGITGEILRNFSVQQDHSGTISAMAHSGVGLWISLRHSSTICLYHTETFRHLQDINVASNVNRLTGKKLSCNVHVTALMASKGLLWVGTNVGIALSIPLPRLEGVPIISGRANVSHHAHSGPITVFLTMQMQSKPTMSPAYPSVSIPQPVSLPSSLPPSGTIQEESENESTSPRSKPVASINQLASHFNTVPKVRSPLLDSPLVLRRRSKESSPLLGKRVSRTLPRGHVLSATECDIFGLYGELMNIKDYEEADGSGLMGGGGGAGAGAVNSMYETLRRSDPDLAAIPAKVSTLDRRLHMKAARPRSLDLSNWSVDSRSSLYTTSSGSEDSASHTMTPSATMSTMSSGQTATLKRCHQRNSDTLKSSVENPRTVLTLSGGRGYIYTHQRCQHEGERKNSVPSPANINDAHIILWEMKL